MSNSTPPGWYPAPGAGPDGTAAQERWWDGNAWTSEVRPAAPADRPPTGEQIADAPTQAWQAAAAQPAAPTAPVAPQAAVPQPGYGYPPQPAAQPAPGYGYPSGYPGQQGPPGYPPGYPPVGGYPPAPRRKGNALVIGVVVAVLAIGGIAAGVALNSGDGPSPKPFPTLAVPTITMPTITVPTVPTLPGDESPTAPPTRRPSPTPSPRVSPDTAVTGTVPDEQHAITVPVLAGWTENTPGSSATVFLTSGPYTCPGGGNCVRGQFAVKADAIQGASARAAAEAAMPLYAQAIFSGLTSHTDAGSAPVVVAGVSGYAVRWHVTTKDGLSGYVLLAAVPAERGGYVAFNGGVDEDPRAPGQAALNQILLGIKQDSTAAGSGA